MSDIAQLNLAEPAQVDWDNAFKGSSYTPPPPALGPDGKFITYYGVVAQPVVDTERPDTNEAGQPVLTYLLDPIKIVKSGKFDGQEIRFTRASTRPYTVTNKEGVKVPKKGNPNKLGEFLRACGQQTQPQTNAQYDACVKQAGNKTFQFSLDWEAYNKETGESVKGYNAFPDDTERPGQKKSILKAGDFYNVLDNKGNVIETKQVKSEVLFANARLKFFRSPKSTQVG